jgi:hypothetical protein
MPASGSACQATQVSDSHASCRGSLNLFNYWNCFGSCISLLQGAFIPCKSVTATKAAAAFHQMLQLLMFLRFPFAGRFVSA